MKRSADLGLPLSYQDYPEYFDTQDNIYNTHEKNDAIEKILHKYNVKTVLDMTCGTGAQVFYLAKLGYNVIGSDFSPGLLKIAREKALQQGVEVEFIDGDMRTLHVGRFDAVITIDNAIGHLVKDDFEIAIRNIHKNLTDGGIYVFDILNLDAMTDDVVAHDSQRMTDKRVTADGTIIYNVRSSYIDRENGYITADNHFTIQKDGVEKKIDNTCSLQIYTMAQLRDILARNGFEAIEQYAVDAYTFKKDNAGYSILTVARKQKQ